MPFHVGATFTAGSIVIRKMCARWRGEVTADLQPGRLGGLRRLAVVLIKAGRCAKSTRHAKQPSNLRGRSAGAVAHQCIA